MYGDVMGSFEDMMKSAMGMFNAEKKVDNPRVENMPKNDGMDEKIAGIISKMKTQLAAESPEAIQSHFDQAAVMAEKYGINRDEFTAMVKRFLG